VVFFIIGASLTQNAVYENSFHRIKRIFTIKKKPGEKIDEDTR